MQGSTANEDGGWYAWWHARVVELGEAEGRLAELAVLLLCVGQPFH